VKFVRRQPDHVTLFIDERATYPRQVNQVGSDLTADVAIVWRVQDQQVRYLAYLQRSRPICAAEGGTLR